MSGERLQDHWSSGCAFWHLLMCHTVVCNDCRAFVQRLTKNQNSVTLPWSARSPDLALIEHVWDILGCKVRYNSDVRPRLQMITAWRLKWAVVPQEQL